MRVHRHRRFTGLAAALILAVAAVAVLIPSSAFAAHGVHPGAHGRYFMPVTGLAMGSVATTGSPARSAAGGFVIVSGHAFPRYARMALRGGGRVGGGAVRGGTASPLALLVLGLIGGAALALVLLFTGRSPARQRVVVAGDISPARRAAQSDDQAEAERERRAA